MALVDYSELQKRQSEAASNYDRVARELQDPSAIEARKSKASSTALAQAQNLSSEKAAKAASAARKSGMTAAQAAMYGGTQANQNVAQDYQNAYSNALAQENQAVKDRLDIAKSQYDMALSERKTERDFGLGIATSILGILSDERLKVIYDRWSKEARK